LTSTMREPKTRRIRKTFAVVVDGETEVWYLNMLKRHERNLNVNIEPRIPQKKKLSEQFDMVCRLAKDNTKVFWIVDFDTLRDETRKARRGAKTAIQEFTEYRRRLMNEYDNIVIIANDPCLEFWYLLHFEDTARLFPNCNEAGRRLKHHLPDYEKSQAYCTKQNGDIYMKLKPRLSTAIRNARALRGFIPDDIDAAKAEMHLFFEHPDFDNYFLR
jgi:hypothetical protein